MTGSNMTKLRTIAGEAATFQRAVKRVVEELGISEGEAKSLLAKDGGRGARLYNDMMSSQYTGE